MYRNRAPFFAFSIRGFRKNTFNHSVVDAGPYSGDQLMQNVGSLNAKFLILKE